MAPVHSDGNYQENQMSDEDFVIYRTKNSYKQDPATAKAWMITAKTLFPRNFAVQLEAYLTQKAAFNSKEAARYFSSLFFDFPNEADLWEEAQQITKALQNDETSDKVLQFHRDLFSHMLIEVQHQLLLSMAERAEDTKEHCRLMIVLLTRLPQFIDTHGKKLVDTLLSAEKHSHFPTSVNFYRKLLVTELMPILLSSKTIDIPQKQLHQLIMKSLEFYVCWSVIDGSSFSQELEGNELKIEESWPNLFQIMFLIARKLGWELGSLFSSDESSELVCQNLWNYYRATPLGGEESPNFRQLLYCGTVILMESLFQYVKKTEPTSLLHSPQGNHNKLESPSFLLVRSFFPFVDGASKTSSVSRRTDENSVTQPLMHVTVTKTCPASTASSLLSSFTTAVSCWELLHQTEELRNEFSKICGQLRTETWTWLPNFIVDGFLYRGMYPEALNRLQPPGSSISNSPSLLIKSAGILFSMGNYVVTTEQILLALSKLTSDGVDEPLQTSVPAFPVTSDEQHHLHFLSMNRAEVVQYCVAVLLACLRELNLRISSDLIAGHLVVLLQYDWPHYSTLLEEIIEKIKRNGQFSYPMFATYVVQVDILEEFAYLATDHGGAVNMDIFPPSAAQLATQRRMTTRRGDQGAREDFRAAMKRQMSRSPENVRELIMRFILNEKESILRGIHQ